MVAATAAIWQTGQSSRDEDIVTRRNELIANWQFFTEDPVLYLTMKGTYMSMHLGSERTMESLPDVAVDFGLRLVCTIVLFGGFDVLPRVLQVNWARISNFRYLMVFGI